MHGSSIIKKKNGFSINDLIWPHIHWIHVVLAATWQICGNEETSGWSFLPN